MSNKPRANIGDALFNHRDSVNFGMDRTRSEGEVNLGVVSITMDGREPLTKFLPCCSPAASL